MTERFDKLVRNNIPEIIAADGQTPAFHVADPEEYHQKLRQKLQEEVDEFQASEAPEKSAEELGDILEVVYALATEIGLDQQSLESLRVQKALQRGDFSDRIILDSID